MNITTDIQAKRISNHLLHHESVVVSESGDIVCNQDVEEVIKKFKKEGKKSFVVKGEYKLKAKNE